MNKKQYEVFYCYGRKTGKPDSKFRSKTILEAGSRKQVRDMIRQVEHNTGFHIRILRIKEVVPNENNAGKTEGTEGTV